MSASAGGGRERVPVLLLKTKSSPTDGYEEIVQSLGDDHQYEPMFVPVLEHRFKKDSLQQIRTLIESGALNPQANSSTLLDGPSYGAIIFTSQRAVEAFAAVVKDIRAENSCQIDACLPSTTPFYVVGPATARGLQALDLQCPILGEESGNGEALATFMLKHYNNLYGIDTTTSTPTSATVAATIAEGIQSIASKSKKPSLLFLVGEKRRDIIPKMLQSDELPSGQKSHVHELEVYETGEMQSFRSEFASICHRTVTDSGIKRQWAVVFSPTGCKAMLQVLGLLDERTGRVPEGTRNDKSEVGGTKTLIATIGPTTRDYLKKEFGFEPHVSAAKPSPEGIVAAIKSYVDVAGN